MIGFFTVQATLSFVLALFLLCQSSHYCDRRLSENYKTKLQWPEVNDENMLEKHNEEILIDTQRFNEAREFELLSRTDVRSLVKNGEAIEYNSNEIGTNEALQAFRLLYTAVKEKGIGIDKVFDEILNN